MSEPISVISRIDPYEVGNQLLVAEHVSYDGYAVQSSLAEIPPVTIRQEDYERALEDINRTFGVFHDPETGHHYEKAIVNPDAPIEEGYDIEYATEKSSLSNNPGNAPEFAANAAAHPGRKRVYIASPGSGLSDDFEPDEHEWIRQSGRMTYEGGQGALPTFVGLRFALEDNGLPPDYGVRISANSAGGAYARGLMAALPPTVTHAYLKNTPGVSSHHPALPWALWDVVMEGRDDKKSARRSHDEWKLTPEIIEAAKARLTNVYGPENKQQTKSQQARTSHSLGKLVTSAYLLGRGGEADGDPLAVDTAKVMKSQPQARVTHHFSLHDRLYDGREDMVRFLEHTYSYLGGVATGYQARLKLIITSGTHRDHTNYPHLRWSAEAQAFVVDSYRSGNPAAD